MQEHQLEERAPKTYFDLIEIVGSGGKYQFCIMIMFLLMWLCTGIILMTAAFLYLNPSFDCGQSGLLTAECKKYVCKLPENQWSQFVPASEMQFKSLANSFGVQYYCDNEIELDLASTMTYLGAFIGYTVISFFSDNWGRRTSLIASWTIGCVGVVILMAAQGIYMAGFGLFLCAMGCDSAVNITIFIFGEVLQNNKRQSYSVVIMAFFPMGAVIVTGLFYIFEDWWIVLAIGLAAPMLLVEIWVIFYLEETPAFLVKKGIQATEISLNRIAKINKTDRRVTLENIQNVVDNQDVQQYNKVITPVDLCRFPSLRVITICGSIVSFATFAVYYGPILIVDSIGFDIYTSNVMLNVADLLCYIPSYYLIEKQPRKLLCIALFGLATFCSAIMVFVQKPEDCDGQCGEAVIELILIFIFRFSVSMEFTVMIIFLAELYPGRARAIGNGFCSAFGTVASTISPIFLGVLDRAEINPMLYFTVLGIIGLGVFTILDETQGKIIPEEIQQIELQKEKKRSQIRSQIGSRIGFKAKPSQIVSSDSNYGKVRQE